MSKIFISHSSLDNAKALAVGEWLKENGWDDFFLDFEPDKGLTPGQRWQEALKDAGSRCDAVILLISPAWCDSTWCLEEFRLARGLGKRIFGVLIEATPLISLPSDLTREWQLGNLVDGNARKTITVYHDPLVPRQDISFSEVALTKLKRGLQQAGPRAPHFTWPPKDDPHRAPYRGLKALEAEDAAIFFGRDADIARGLDKLRFMRVQDVEQLFVILGASGTGKSSFLRAGLWPRLKRDDRHFLPLPVIRPARNAITGSSGLAASVQGTFEQLGQKRNLGDLIEAFAQPSGLAGLLEELQALAQKQLGFEGDPPTIVLAIDQGEELFNEDGREEAERLLALLGLMLTQAGTADHTALAARKRLLTIMALRSDTYERVQMVPTLSSVMHNLFDLRPLGREEIKVVIEGPARVMIDTGRKLIIEAQLTAQLLEDARGLDTLPLLAFILEQLYLQYGSDGDLRLDEYHKLGGLRGAFEAAIAAAFQDPTRFPTIPANPEDRDRILRKAFIPLLVTIDQETENPKRRVAQWDGFPPQSYPLLERLIDARLLSRDKRGSAEQGVEQVAVEISHEALTRHWEQLKSWIDADRKFLLWHQRLNGGRREWEAHRRRAELLLRGQALREAEGWLTKRAEDFSRDERLFVTASLYRRKKIRMALTTMAGFVLMVIGLIAWLWGYGLNQAVLKVQSPFRNIHREPDMQVVAAGRFRQGDTHDKGQNDEKPVHEVTLKAFAIGKFEVTFDEYDRFALTTSRLLPNDQGWGRGERPVINVSWQDAKDYAAWLSDKTGKRYRLPTESEWEYAARSEGKDDLWAGTSDVEQLKFYAVYTVYSQNRTAPVGHDQGRKPNALGLYDMSGNVLEWVEDCLHDTYETAPTEGAAWLEAGHGDCQDRMNRGGAWGANRPETLRVSRRFSNVSGTRNDGLGFRLAQDLQ